MTRHISGAVALLMLAAPAFAQEPASASFARNGYYAAGERVDVPDGVSGDVVVAGRTIAIARPVAGDVLAAGWRVTMTGTADDDVRIAGNEVLINAPIAGDLTTAGRRVTLGPATHVYGNSWVTGETVLLNGVVEREMRVAAAHVTIGGEVRQPLRIVAETLNISASARVLAPIMYEGSTPATVAAGAVMTQSITYRNIPAREAREARSPYGFTGLLFALHLFIGGMLLFVVVPRFAAAPADTLRAQPWRSLAVGLLLTVGGPFVALVFVVSMIGLPVGLILGAAYLSALFLAVLTTAVTIGAIELRAVHAEPATTRSQQALMLLAGVLTLTVLRAALGGVVVFAAVLFGFGALGLWVYRNYTTAAAHA